MDEQLVIKVPINVILCDSCKKIEVKSFYNDSNLQYIRFDYSEIAPGELNEISNEIELEITKINWTKNSNGEYFANGTVKLICPCCDKIHYLEKLMNSPKLIISNLLKCQTCLGDLLIKNENIEYQDNFIYFSASLICEKCNTTNSISETKKITLNETIPLVIKNSEDNSSYNLNFNTHTSNAILKKKIFFSYSKNDLKYLIEFKKHFATLERLGYIDTWYDAMIEPGKLWDITIKHNLEESDIIICLLSPDFIANKYVWNTEMKHALDNRDCKTIVPIFIIPCDVENTFLAEHNGTVNVKHLPPDYTAYKNVNENGTIWIGLEKRKPNRDLYYKLIIDQIKIIIKK